MFQAIGFQNLSLKERVNNKLNCDIEEIFVRVEEEIINSRLNNNKDDIINFIKIYYL